MTPEEEKHLMSWDDGMWIIACSFMVFTMQSGFALMESGNAHLKNQVNIMVKKVIDIVFGGFSYWIFGYAFTYGISIGANRFLGIGDFFTNRPATDIHMGSTFANYVFQLSFSSTATTIASGAMAERARFRSYILFAFVNTLVYVVPAHWLWSSEGFLYQMGAVDMAGCGPVHLVGGTSALVCTLMLGPRSNRFSSLVSKTTKSHAASSSSVSTITTVVMHPNNSREQPTKFNPPLGNSHHQENGKHSLQTIIDFQTAGNPANIVLGMFMLWWGWLAFNCGSTGGVSYGKWRLAAKVAANTLNSSMAAGLVGIVLSNIIYRGIFKINFLVNAVLGGLVAITGCCGVVRPWEAYVIGAIGAVLVLGCDQIVRNLKIDDPVSSIAVHMCGGAWGLLAGGIFMDIDPLENANRNQLGLIHAGGFRSLGVQLLTVVVVATWSFLSTVLILGTIKLTIGLRLSKEEEHLGSDFVEHDIRTCVESTSLSDQGQIGYSPPRRMSALLIQAFQNIQNRHNY